MLPDGSVSSFFVNISLLFTALVPSGAGLKPQRGDECAWGGVAVNSNNISPPVYFFLFLLY